MEHLKDIKELILEKPGRCIDLVDLLVKIKPKKAVKLGSSYKHLLSALAHEDLLDGAVVENILGILFEIDPKRINKYLIKQGFPAEKLSSFGNGNGGGN